MEEFGLKFDEEGNCPLLVEGNFPVNVFRDEAQERLVLSAPIAPELPEWTDYPFMQVLLDFAIAPMFGSQPAIGRDPESGMIIVYSILSLKNLTPAMYQDVFSGFVAFAMGLQDRFALEPEETEKSTSEKDSTLLV